jgi:hypothetical protein
MRVLVNKEEAAYAELVLEECRVSGTVSFGYWKRETEELIGREMGPVEATNLFDMIGGRR